MTFDCAIIGAGPAGIAAAIQLARTGYKVVLFEKKRIGGLLWNANLVENYLGFPGGIAGDELVKLFDRQLREHSIQIELKEVLRVSKGSNFRIQTADGVFEAKTVLAAVGTTPKPVGIKGEEKLAGEQLFYEIADLQGSQAPNPPWRAGHGISDNGIWRRTEPRRQLFGRGASYPNHKVLIIGGGDAAFDYALQLKKFGHSPSIFCRGTPNPLPLLAERVRDAGIPVHPNSHPKILRRTGEGVELVTDGQSFLGDFILVAAGRDPTPLDLPKTDTQGLFFAGDIRNGTMRQVHIATGDGMRAALDISHYLSHESPPGVRQRRRGQSVSGRSERPPR